MKIKIMTFNTQHCLNFVTRKIDFDVMAEAIRKENPDVVGLEEMRNTGLWYDYRDQVGILAYRTGMNGVFGEAIKFGGINPYGVGLLSKFPIIKSSVTKIPDPNPPKYKGYYETRCVLRTELDIGEGKKLSVCVSHFGLNPDEHENAVRTAVETVPDKKAIFMGDLNMTPENGLLTPIFNKLTDTASVKPDEKLFTFDSVNPRAKIDYIFVSKDVTPVDAYVPETVASDHRPYVSIVEV